MRYYVPCNYKGFFELSGPEKLSLLHYNINSIPKLFDNFASFTLGEYEPSVIAFCGNKTSPTLEHIFKIDGYDAIFDGYDAIIDGYDAIFNSNSSHSGGSFSSCFYIYVIETH